MSQTVSIPLPSRDTVAGTVWHAADAGLAVVVHPATATPARFYNGLGEWLAAQGCSVLTYDYRGAGASGPARQHRTVRMRDWMSVDVPAATHFANETFGDLPLVAVGHSIGGHALALGHGVDPLTAFAMISSHAGVTSRIPDRSERRRVGAFFALAPPVSRLLGVAPGRAAGFGEDFPAAALQEWAPWTRLPGYFFDDPSMNAHERAARVQVPVLAVGASDDAWATPAQIEAITDHLVSTTVTRRTYTPTDLDTHRIGHHGLMRRGVGEPFWKDLLAWFRERL